MVHGKADVTFSLCRSSLFWDVTPRWLAVSYRRFGSTYRYHCLVSRSPRVYVIRGFLNLSVGRGTCTSLPTGTIRNTELPSVYAMCNHLHTSSPHLSSSVLHQQAHIRISTVYSVYDRHVVCCIWAGRSGVWFSAGERDICLLQNV
jgi:hypothetical protein